MQNDRKQEVRWKDRFVGRGNSKYKDIVYRVCEGNRKYFCEDL